MNRKRRRLRKKTGSRADNVVKLKTSGNVRKDHSKTYIIKQRELMTMLVNYASQQLGVDAPFIHHVQFHKADPTDPEAVLVTIRLERTDNVYNFPRKKR